MKLFVLNSSACLSKESSSFDEVIQRDCVFSLYKKCNSCIVGRKSINAIGDYFGCGHLFDFFLNVSEVHKA